MYDNLQLVTSNEQVLRDRLTKKSHSSKHETLFLRIENHRKGFGLLQEASRIATEELKEKGNFSFGRPGIVSVWSK